MGTIFMAFTLKDSSVAEFFAAIANKLAHQNKVIIISYQTEENKLLLDKRIKILEWPSIRPTGMKDFFFLLNNVRKYKPYMMISNFAAVNLFLLTGYIVGVRKRICWYHTHSSAHTSENQVHLWRKKIIYRFSTRVITTSASAKEDLAKHYNVNTKKIVVLPNAVREPTNIPVYKRNLSLVFVGRLHPAKGFDVLLNSLPKVISRFPKLEIKIIGGGSNDIEKYLAEAKTLKISERINFIGFTSKSKVMEELANAYICIVPSYYEAFCYVVIESFSVGTPVIGSDTTGIGEIIENGKNGFLFERGNHEELSDKILELLNDPLLRKEMSQNAYRSFQEKYELNGIANQFMKLADGK